VKNNGVPQLFIGSIFAFDRHSRIYRYVYKQKDVAIKFVSQPEEDEDLASFVLTMAEKRRGGKILRS